jgi:hypothetical protein
MPTILLLNGWRFFFYAEEGHEPPHVHCEKGDADAKYWLNPETFEISEARAHGMSTADKRLVRRIIYEHFDYFVAEWNSFQERRNG